MKLRNRKHVENDVVAKPSQQFSVDKNPQALDEGFTIISICEDNGDVEIISSKDMDNSSQHQNKTKDDDLILVEETSPSQEQSNPRKRKRSGDDDDDVKVLDNVEGEVIFVEEVKKSKILCDEIVLVDTQKQDGRAVAGASGAVQPNFRNTSKTCGPPIVEQPRRLFVNPQHAASDLVEKLIHLGEQRVHQEESGQISPQEYHMIMGVKVHWRAANLRRNLVDNETNQEFCWRVRRFTKGALMNVSRQMSQHSSLAWAIVANNRDHTAQFLEKQKTISQSANLRPVPFQVKNEPAISSTVKTDSSQQNSSGPDLLPDLSKVKKEKEETER